MSNTPSTYTSITLNALYKCLYKEFLELSEPTLALSKSTRLLLEFNESQDTAKEALAGLETLMLYLRNFKPNQPCVFAAILSAYSMEILMGNRKLFYSYEAQVLTLAQNLKKLHHIYLDPEMDDTIKEEALKLNFYENTNVAQLGIIQFIQLANKLTTMPEEVQHSICNVARNFFIPLLHRLGLVELKAELEDCCMEVIQPQDYIKILKGMLKRLHPIKHEFMKNFCIELEKTLITLNAPIKLNYRLKSAYSTWYKLKSQNLLHEDLHDYIGVRIIIETDRETEIALCNEVYDIIVTKYKIDHSKTRNWLLEPRESGYQALHVTIVDIPKVLIEIQIRGKHMHEVAERGSAAHWIYKKESGKNKKNDENCIDNDDESSKMSQAIIEELEKTLKQE